MLKKVAIYLVHVYQNFISPIIGGRAACRYIPSCSEYMKQAIEKYGVVRGSCLGIKRICRCRPHGGFGYDPVP